MPSSPIRAASQQYDEAFAPPAHAVSSTSPVKVESVLAATTSSPMKEQHQPESTTSTTTAPPAPTSLATSTTAAKQHQIDLAAARAKASGMMSQLKEQIQQGTLVKNVLSKLDANGDGQLSIEELEDAGSLAVKKLEEAWGPVRDFLHKYRDGAYLGIGYLAAFYGGNFKLLFMASNLANGTEGEEVLQSFRELARVTSESKKKFKERLGPDHVLIRTDSKGVPDAGSSSSSSASSLVTSMVKSGVTDMMPAALREKVAGVVGAADASADGAQTTSCTAQPRTSLAIPSSTIMAFLSCVEPHRFVECVTAVYKAFLIALCATLNNNAAKFGLGVALGERISTFLLAMMDRVLLKAEREVVMVDAVENVDGVSTVARSPLKTAEGGGRMEEKMTASPLKVKRVLTDEEKEALMIQKFPAWQWLKLGLRSFCTTLGLFLSWRLKDAAATFSVCHWGGSTIARALFKMMKHKDAALQEMVALGIGWYGFAYHLRQLNRPALPLLLSIPLLPLTIIERVLQGLTLRSELAP